MTIGRDYLFSDAKCLKLDIDFPHTEIFKEVSALRNKFVEYRSSYNTKGWYSLPIIGKSSKEPYSWDCYYDASQDAVKDMQWTEIAELCPVTKQWLEQVYPSKHYARVRFMLLEPGGYIEPHTDTNHQILGAVNFAITNPKECVWHWDNDTLDFLPGDAYAVNISYMHSVKNNSDQDRYHLIVHHYDSTNEWKSMMTKAMEDQNVQGNFHFSTELF
jgi:hypothetical protein